MFKVLFDLFRNLDGLNEQVVKMRQHFAEANGFLDSKVGSPAEGDAAPAIEDRSHKNGNGRKIVAK
jgi:hypothetical protein